MTGPIASIAMKPSENGHAQCLAKTINCGKSGSLGGNDPRTFELWGNVKVQ